MNFLIALLFASTAKAEAPTIPEPQPIEIKQELPQELVNVAICESGNHQFNPDGTVLRGIVNHLDVGRFQINEKYHLLNSEKMGINIYTEEGNTAYALYLYKKNGLSDWLASEPCWKKAKFSPERS